MGSGPPLGNQNGRKYEEGATCDGPECDKPVYVRGYCQGHHAQKVRGLGLTPIGTRGRRKKMGFSTERHCYECGETVDWKQYYLEKDQCRACWTRKYHEIKTNEYGETVAKRMQDLMDYISTMSKE